MANANSSKSKGNSPKSSKSDGEAGSNIAEQFSDSLPDYKLPNRLRHNIEYNVSMAKGFAQSIDDTTVRLLDYLPPGDDTNMVLGVIACARQIIVSLQNAQDRLAEVTND